MKKKQQLDCPYCHDIKKCHSIYLSNVLLLNQSGINLQSGTMPHVKKNIALEQNEIKAGVLRYTSFSLTFPLH